MKKSLPFLIFCFFFFAISVFAQEARKIDEFGNTSCDDFLSRLEGLFVELNGLKDTKGYVFVYEGRMLNPLYNQQNKTVYPRRGEAKAELENVRRHIIFRNYDKNGIVLVEGGFRARYTVEFWIVPNNATPPKESPTLKKMKYRKGKAEYSCKYL